MIQKEGADRLTEEKFSVPANRETVLFRDGERLYGVGYYLDADYYNPGHSALDLWIVSEKSRARYSARTTWAPMEKFNQLRIDVEHHEGGRNSKEFFLCSDR